jgi:hypothetical protein
VHYAVQLKGPKLFDSMAHFIEVHHSLIQSDFNLLKCMSAPLCTLEAFGNLEAKHSHIIRTALILASTRI